MIEISNELRTKFLTTSSHKDLEIEFENSHQPAEPNDFSRVNFFSTYEYTPSVVYSFTETARDYNYGTTSEKGFNLNRILRSDDSSLLRDYVHFTKYLYVDFSMRITAFNGATTPGYVVVKLLTLKPMDNSNYGNASIEPVVLARASYSDVAGSSNYNFSGCVEFENFPETHTDIYDIAQNNSYVLYFTFEDENGDLYPFVSGTTYTCNFSMPCDVLVQIGDDETAFPYVNSVQVEYRSLDINDYITYTPPVDKYSEIDFTPLAGTNSIILNDVTIDTTPGVVTYNTFLSLDDNLINDYIMDEAYIRLFYQVRLTEFTPVDDITPYSLNIDGEYECEDGTTIKLNYWNLAVSNPVLNQWYTSNTYIRFLPEVCIGSSLTTFKKVKKIKRLWLNMRGTQNSGTSRQARCVFEVKNLSIQISKSKYLLPYQNTTAVDALHLDINDYIIVEDDSFTLTNPDIKQEAFSLTESVCSSDVLKFGTTESAICSFSIVNVPNENLVGRYFRPYISCSDVPDERIPLGRFRVKKVTKSGSHNFVTKQIEAYDGMYPLNMDATDWYSKYVGIIEEYYDNTQTYIVSRQLFSTLYNATQCLNIDLEISNIASESYTFHSLSQMSGGRRILLHRDGADDSNSDFIDYGILGWSSGAEIVVNPSKVYKVEIGYDYRTDIFTYMEDGGNKYYNTFGIYPDNGGIIIREFDDNDDLIYAFCVDDKEWFALHPNTRYIIIGIVTRLHTYLERHSGSGESTLVLHDETILYPSTMTLYSGEFTKLNSNNLSLPMVYYNWSTKECAKASSITFRDVIRSLVEITGSFFKYDRYGNAVFVQYQKAGLYPSETLYPSENLYPTEGINGPILPMSMYKSFRCDDAPISDFGKIQIVGADLKTYVGSEDRPNTYIIDDNIFYSDSVATYKLNPDGSESLPQVVEMLENLYNVIRSLKYTPCEIDAIGMPWVECGDRVGLLTKYGGFESFIFTRNLTGIQALDDEIEAYGEENTEEVIELWR